MAVSRVISAGRITIGSSERGMDKVLFQEGWAARRSSERYTTPRPHLNLSCCANVWSPSYGTRGQ